MTFDKDRVLTEFTTNEGVKGVFGWGADCAESLERKVGNEKYLEELRYTDTSSFPFIVKRGKYDYSYRYFLPAPYEYMQEKWVKENSVKAGDRVYVKRSWKKGEGGFDFVCDVPICQSYKITKVCDDGIEVKREPKVDPLCGDASPAYHAVPYFALELVEPKYRKFANAEEFEPHEHRTLRRGEKRFKVLSYDHFDVVIINLMIGEIWEMEACTYSVLLDSGFVFNDTGEPAGVKL